MLAAGCAGGSPGLVLGTTQSERQVGREEARKVEQHLGFAGSEALQSYVSRLGARLVEHSPSREIRYTFHIVDMQQPNAFALPGGYIYISRGLLALTNSEDELANVVAHEIAHVAERHSVKQARRSTLFSPIALATGIAGAAAGIVSPAIGGAVAGLGQLAGGVVLASYSRDQEREADEVGQRVAAAAGFDPAGMARFMATLTREDTFARGSKRQSSFFDSHPSTPEREASTARHASSLPSAPAGPDAHDRRAFFAELDGLIVADDPASGVVQGRDFRHPDMNLGLTFPEGWTIHNGRDQVAAVAPDGNAFVTLTAVGNGNDPIDGAAAAKRHMGFSLEGIERTKIGGLEAAHLGTEVATPRGRAGVDLTWIAHAGVVYQVTGVAPATRFAGIQGKLTAVAASFRSLDARERAAIKVSRLRVVEAREGESLARLLDRANSAWSPGFAAIANALAPDRRFAAGELVKVAVEEPYAAASR